MTQEYEISQSDRPIRWHLASYPRSGSHLVRTVIEFTTKTPTVGSFNAATDVPISKRPANKRAGIIALTTDPAVVFKTHFTEDIFHREVASPGPWGLILITRDPRSAISSNIARMRNPGYLSFFGRSKQRRKTVRLQTRTYVDLLYLYHAYRNRPRLHLRFEHLVDTQLRAAEIGRLCALLGVAEPTLTELDKLYSLAKETKAALPERMYRSKAKIDSMIHTNLTDDLVQEFLGSDL